MAAEAGACPGEVARLSCAHRLVLMFDRPVGLGYELSVAAEDPSEVATTTIRARRDARQNS